MELEGVGRWESHGSGRPVIILSNPQADPEWWAAPIMAALAEAGYDPITFTPTGHDFTPAGAVNDVGTFIEHLDRGPVALLGWSQGAAVAQEVALRFPDRVTCAVLIATYGRQNLMAGVMHDAWAALSRYGSHLDPARYALTLLSSHPPAMLGDDAGSGELIDGVKEWVGEAPIDDEPRRRSSAFILNYVDRLDALGDMKVPCLVIGFELDADTFAARAREVAEAIPDAEYLEIAGAGHLAPVTDPPSVIEPMLAFLQKQS